MVYRYTEEVGQLRACRRYPSVRPSIWPLGRCGTLIRDKAVILYMGAFSADLRYVF